MKVRIDVIHTSLFGIFRANMGIGVLLSQETFPSRYCYFGSFSEVNGTVQVSRFEANETFPPFALMGMEIAPAVIGLTEVGTLVALAHEAADLPENRSARWLILGVELLLSEVVLASAKAQTLGHE